MMSSTPRSLCLSRYSNPPKTLRSRRRFSKILVRRCNSHLIRHNHSSIPCRMLNDPGSEGRSWILWTLRARTDGTGGRSTGHRHRKRLNSGGRARKSNSRKIGSVGTGRRSKAGNAGVVEMGIDVRCCGFGKHLSLSCCCIVYHLIRIFPLFTPESLRPNGPARVRADRQAPRVRP